MDFDVIKNKRDLLQMTQVEFSQYLKIPYRTYQNWEVGIRKCPDYVIDMIVYKLENKLPDIKQILENDLETETNTDVVNYINKLLNLINS